MAHVAGQSRYQVELVAPALDDLVGSDHPVRVIDAFVGTLDLRHLGFARVEAEATGRPPYAPGDLLKLYIYGYMNQMRSSRRLEREAARNFEVKSWSRSFEQDSAKAKWTAARVGPLQFRARGVTEGGRSPTGDTSCARRKIHAAAARGDGVK